MARLGRAQPFKPLTQRAVPASSVVTVALTGSAATTAAGSLVPQFSIPTSGAAATSTPGSLALNFSLGLSGTAIASSIGNLGVAVQATLAGQAATGTPGTFGVDFKIPLAGSSATGTPGTMTPVSGTVVALTGSTITTGIGTLVPSFGLSLVGVRTTTTAGILTVPVAVCQVAFQANAFQGNAFQLCGTGPPVGATYGGVWMYGLEHWKRLRGELEEEEIPLPVVAEIAEVVQRIPEPRDETDTASRLLLRLELERSGRKWQEAYIDALTAYRAGYTEYLAELSRHDQVRRAELKERAEAEAKVKARRRHTALFLLLNA